MRLVASCGGFSPGVDVPLISSLGPNDNRPWHQAALWAADCLRHSATKADTGWRSTLEVWFSRLPDLQLVPFFQNSTMRVDRLILSDVQSVLCYLLCNDYSHLSSTEYMRLRP